MITAIALTLLGSAGLLLSLYAALAYYGLLSPSPRLAPAVCLPGAPACATVLRAPGARLLGVPNALLGIGFYVGVLVSAALDPGAAPAFDAALLGAGALALAASAYLSYELLVRLRTRCAVCFASHAVNACLAAVLLFRGA